MLASPSVVIGRFACNILNAHDPVPYSGSIGVWNIEQLSLGKKELVVVSNPIICSRCGNPLDGRYRRYRVPCVAL